MFSVAMMVALSTVPESSGFIGRRRNACANTCCCVPIACCPVNPCDVVMSQSSANSVDPLASASEEVKTFLADARNADNKQYYDTLPSPEEKQAYINEIQAQLDKAKTDQGDKGDKGSDSDKGDQARLPTPATVVIHVPANASVYFDDTPTRQAGVRREFVSPPLHYHLDYHYKLTAKVVRNGQIESLTQSVTVRPGHVSEVTFDFNTSSVVQK